MEARRQQLAVNAAAGAPSSMVFDEADRVS